jgi:hypothetical protein
MTTKTLKQREVHVVPYSETRLTFFLPSMTFCPIFFSRVQAISKKILESDSWVPVNITKEAKEAFDGLESELVTEFKKLDKKTIALILGR